MTRNLGLNARYNSRGPPKGQILYIYRALYNGVLADFIIKSNVLSALQFSGTTYPISSTLQGKANVQVNRASDGYTLFSAGNYTFSSTVTDSGQNGATGKQFSLIVYDSSAVPYYNLSHKSPPAGLLAFGITSGLPVTRAKSRPASTRHLWAFDDFLRAVLSPERAHVVPGSCRPHRKPYLPAFLWNSYWFQ